MGGAPDAWDESGYTEDVSSLKREVYSTPGHVIPSDNSIARTTSAKSVKSGFIIVRIHRHES